ncbi:unnamed protein product [Polarella glacialis]|uniref:Fe2OG dioxygenase domain-containing protein n=1 Tax=Polarella glacialis TaxID=89957 RepID=A0A813M104_POLGL|nr:unnamed protein product [Polarella glacialis]CAE8743850.1 unnamed protein product [Polarella glacialis]
MVVAMSLHGRARAPDHYSARYSLLGFLAFVAFTAEVFHCSTAFLGSFSRACGARVNQRLRCSAAAEEQAGVSQHLEVVVDFAGNGTAFALAESALPDGWNFEPSRRLEVPTFSPGFVVDSVISTEACQRIVHLAEQCGFRQRFSASAVTLFMPEDFSHKIFERLKPHLPDHFGGRPIGINRRWAVLKYPEGKYFGPHVDGNVPGTTREGDELKYEKGTRSYMTCLFWLSDDLEGGETVFAFPQGGIWVAIPPKTGAALLFFHGQNAIMNPMHYGGDVRSGVKYLVRSDIIYEN